MQYSSLPQEQHLKCPWAKHWPHSPSSGITQRPTVRGYARRRRGVRVCVNMHPHLFPAALTSNRVGSTAFCIFIIAEPETFEVQLCSICFSFFHFFLSFSHFVRLHARSLQHFRELQLMLKREVWSAVGGKKGNKLILQTELGALHGRGVTGRPIMKPYQTPQQFLSNPSCL